MTSSPPRRVDNTTNTSNALSPDSAGNSSSPSRVSHFRSDRGGVQPLAAVVVV